MEIDKKTSQPIFFLKEKIKNKYYELAFNETYSIDIRLKALKELQKLTQHKDLTPRIIQVESYKEIL